MSDRLKQDGSAAVLEDIEQQMRALEERKQRIEQELGQQAAEAPRPVSASAGALAIGGSVINAQIVVGDANALSDDDLYASYLQWLAGRAERLPLGKVQPRFVTANSDLRLSQVYVELEVSTPPVPKEDEDCRDWSWRLARGADGEHRDLLEAVSGQARHHILLGDPGSGKTTFAQHLCFLLATGDRRLPESLVGLVPVRLTLRQLAGSVPRLGQGQASLLWTALQASLDEAIDPAGARRLMDLLRGRLLTDGGLWILDGLDEVPTTADRRERLLQAVEDLAASFGEQPSRLLVTARPYAYSAESRPLSGFETLGVAPFRQPQVETFIERWYQVVRSSLDTDALNVAAKAKELRDAIADQSYLADLASQPLLLTLMATLHASGKLPEDRADLYATSTDLLLYRWQDKRRVWDDESQKEITEPSILRVLKVPESRLLNALAALAFAVHQRQREAESETLESGQTVDRPADISHHELLEAFEDLQGDLTTRQLTAYLRDRAGLLISPRDGVYMFPHRCIQEYLAAHYLADRGGSRALIRQLEVDPLWWREVVLLGYGKIARGGTGSLLESLLLLLPSDPPDEVDQVKDIQWRRALVSGLLAIELRLGQAAAEQGTANNFQPPFLSPDEPTLAMQLERIRQWLSRLVAGGHLPAKERLEAGDALGRLGDSRPGVATTTVGETVWPDIDWLTIPRGSFILGSPDDDPEAKDWEKPAHPVKLRRFWISRYPITNTQYAVFLREVDYDDPDLWGQRGLAWLRGELEPEIEGLSEEERKNWLDWLARRPPEKRQLPFWWGHPRWASPSRPVVGISWFEALAFSRWLGRRLRTTRRAPLPRGVGRQPFGVHLPNEAEWERASRGGAQTIWPWKTQYDPEKANVRETGLSQTSSVGMFPEGQGGFGLQDAIGNVWEWTSTLWGEDARSEQYGYRWQPDEREEVERRGFRILRGGSYWNSGDFARCASRSGSILGTSSATSVFEWFSPWRILIPDF